MGICTNCIYIGDMIEEPPKKPHGKFCYEYTRNGHRMHCMNDVFGPDYKCLNVDNADTDFVTGDIELGSCRVKNGFGECLFFDDGSVDIYAWKKDDYIIYTLTTTPKEEDDYYNKDGDKLGILTNTAALYAWKLEDTVGFFTLTPTPFVDYTVYSPDGTILGVIKEVTEEGIKVKGSDESYIIEDNLYIRDEEADINNALVVLDSDFYFRSEENDTKVILPDPEEEPTDPVDPEPTDPVDPDPIVP